MEDIFLTALLLLLLFKRNNATLSRVLSVLPVVNGIVIGHNNVSLGHSDVFGFNANCLGL
jgi:hypothetical protein